MPTPLSNSAAMDALVEELLTKDVYIYGLPAPHGATKQRRAVF